MTTSAQHLRAIQNTPDLVRYLEDHLEWPLDGYDLEDLTFEYEAEEMGLKPEETAKIKVIHQLRPLSGAQPWGIFFVEFEQKRIPIAVLRRILSHLVVRKRATRADRAAWAPNDLLFITSFGGQPGKPREIAFAHFQQEPNFQPTLRVLGWDGADTALKLDYVAEVLKNQLSWPPNPADHAAWRRQWGQAFRHRVGHVIRTADALAENLAELARRIRDAATTLLLAETDQGPLRMLHQAFQATLIHDLSQDDFADTYAQTITYGLLTAAISRTDYDAGRYGTALQATDVAAMVPVTNPFLKEMLEVFLKAGGNHSQRKGGIDFDELGIQDVVELLRGEDTDLPAILRDFGNRTRGDDPVIHFYEHFLRSYNNALKVKRGVFYTPQPVVSYIVRSVHELLQTEFGLPDGLADISTWAEVAARRPGLLPPAGTALTAPFVTVLDPATGTGTFLVEVIEVIHRTLLAKWKAQRLSETQQLAAWNDYVPQHLLPRLFGYELMMAPYAIAHMKIGLKLAETRYRFHSTERARIYLTNALEPAQDFANQFTFAVPALAHEAQAVNVVKRDQRFTVVVGNPPYSGISTNNGPWITEKIEDYKYVDGQHFGERKHWLQDDYVKFIRLAEDAVECNGEGIVGYITNHGYFENTTFRGMRWHLLNSFNTICALDLHGNSNKKETAPDGSKDENIFDIQQGVASIIAVRNGGTKAGLAQVVQADLFGKRLIKYTILDGLGTSGVELFNKVEPQSPYFFFSNKNFNLVSKSGEDYNSFLKLTDLFQTNVSGIVTARDAMVVDMNKSDLKQRMIDFSNPARKDEEVRRAYFGEKPDGKYRTGDSRGWRLIEARKKIANANHDELIAPVTHRPFDNRYIYYSQDMVDWPRVEVMPHFLRGKNLGLIVPKQTKEAVGGFITENIITHKTFSAYDINYVFPLYLYPDPSHLYAAEKRHPNFKLEAIARLAQATGLRFVAEASPYDKVDTFTPEGVLDYVYGILHQPAYLRRYYELLRIDFPRVPLPASAREFREVFLFGRQLRELHLLRPAALPAPLPTRVVGPPAPTAKSKYDPATQQVYLSAAQYVEPVSAAVWALTIGGYQPAQKWLKDRQGRSLSADEILHYQKLLAALEGTERLMRKWNDEHPE